MNISKNGIEFIASWEKLRLVAYLDQKNTGVWTIGYGSTFYQSGQRVKSGDTITPDKAFELLMFGVTGAVNAVWRRVMDMPLTQNQLDALVSFTYNVGAGNFAGSTLLKTILKNPNDAYIETCFLMYTKERIKGALTHSRGLFNRRTAEVKLYFKK